MQHSSADPLCRKAARRQRLIRTPGVSAGQGAYGLTLRRQNPMICALFFQCSPCHGHQAHLPAQQSQARPRPRFPCAHEDSRWPQGHQRASRQGPQAPRGLTGRAVATPARFPRTARLLAPRDFAALRSGSRRFAGPHLTAQVKPNSGDAARLGLAVSRRVSKLAVQRNRIKRIARDSFRRHRHLLGALDILLIAHPAAATADNARLHGDLQQLWQRIAALNAGGSTGTMRG